ncbi:MAG: phosphatidate cytidylyltransferase [Burkholderiales bacterium]|nr:phosphatidate cytidylyltransferase [Burkholderiales bacterium]
MLRTRFITALVLLALVVPALLWLPVDGFAMFVLVFVAAAAWEWARLCGFGMPAALAYAGLTVAGALALGMAARGDAAPVSLAAFSVAAIGWAGIAVSWATRGAGAPRGRWLAALGLMLLLPCWWAVVQARAAGALFLFLLMGLVWVADIGAYFAGRRFGRHKLAPAVSPGKTWEGVAGGLAAGILLAVVCAGLTTAAGGAWDSWFAWLFAAAGRLGPGGFVGALAVVALLVGFSVLGDLFESLLKRRAGVKDSSGLLPGHGGVLDRIDALIPTMPIAMLLFAALQPAG